MENTCKDFLSEFNGCKNETISECVSDEEKTKTIMNDKAICPEVIVEDGETETVKLESKNCVKKMLEACTHQSCK